MIFASKDASLLAGKTTHPDNRILIAFRAVYEEMGGDSWAVRQFLLGSASDPRTSQLVLDLIEESAEPGLVTPYERGHAVRVLSRFLRLIDPELAKATRRRPREEPK